MSKSKKLGGAIGDLFKSVKKLDNDRKDYKSITRKELIQWALYHNKVVQRQGSVEASLATFDPATGVISDENLEAIWKRYLFHVKLNEQRPAIFHSKDMALALVDDVQPGRISTKRDVFSETGKRFRGDVVDLDFDEEVEAAGSSESPKKSD